MQQLSPWPWPLIMALGALLVWWVFDRPVIMALGALLVWWVFDRPGQMPPA